MGRHAAEVPRDPQAALLHHQGLEYWFSRRQPEAQDRTVLRWKEYWGNLDLKDERAWTDGEDWDA